MYLVDTDVLSATAPTKAVARRDLRDWMARNGAGLYLSVITVSELQSGIVRSRRTGAHAKAGRLESWLDTVLHLYLDRIVPIDGPTARQIGTLTDYARGLGHDPELADWLSQRRRSFAAIGS